MVGALVYIFLLGKPNYNITSNLPSKVGNFTLKNTTDMTTHDKGQFASEGKNPNQLIASFQANYGENVSIGGMAISKFLFKNNSDSSAEFYWIINNTNAKANLFDTGMTQLNLPDNVTELYYTVTYGTLVSIVTNGEVSQLQTSRVVNGTLVQTATSSTPVYFITLEKSNGQNLTVVNYYRLAYNISLSVLNNTTENFLSLGINDINITQNQTK